MASHSITLYIFIAKSEIPLIMMNADMIPTEISDYLSILREIDDEAGKACQDQDLR